MRNRRFALFSPRPDASRPPWVGRCGTDFRLVRRNRLKSRWLASDRFDRGTLKASQHVLIAGPLGHAHEGLPAALKALDLVVSRAPTFDVADRAVQCAHDLALVVVDGTTQPEQAAALLGRVKDLQRSVPVLWIGADPCGSPPPDARLPATAGLPELEEKAKALLFDDLYPPRLVRAFVSACNTAITTLFDCGVESADPTLSRAAVRIGNVTGFMLMNGALTSAHLALSSDEATLCQLGYRIGFDATEGKRRLAIDMASELLNQIMGRMKATSELLEVLQLSLPYVFTGEGLSVYAPTSKPSLTLQLTCNEDSRGAINIDFWYKTRIPPDPEAERRAAELADGGLLFL